MSILTKKKTTEDFEEKLTNLATNTRENIQASINNFKKFVSEKHQSTPDQISIWDSGSSNSALFGSSSSSKRKKSGYDSLFGSG